MPSSKPLAEIVPFPQPPAQDEGVLLFNLARELDRVSDDVLLAYVSARFTRTELLRIVPHCASC